MYDKIHFRNHIVNYSSIVPNLDRIRLLKSFFIQLNISETDYIIRMVAMTNRNYEFHRPMTRTHIRKTYDLFTYQQIDSKFKKKRFCRRWHGFRPFVGSCIRTGKRGHRTFVSIGKCLSRATVQPFLTMCSR